MSSKVGGDIKRVGRGGQISLGKRFAGQTFRTEERDDGTIVLVPVAVPSKSHWSIRDGAKIASALRWAAEHPLGTSSIGGSRELGCAARLSRSESRRRRRT